MRNWKRKFVVLKTILSRGYIWCQLPALSIIGAGVLAPYFPKVRLAYLAGAAFIIMLSIGWIDVHFRFLNEEQKYMTEKNPTLMEGLFGNKGTATKNTANATTLHSNGSANATSPEGSSAQEIIDNLEEKNER